MNDQKDAEKIASRLKETQGERFDTQEDSRVYDEWERRQMFLLMNWAKAWGVDKAVQGKIWRVLLEFWQ